MCSFTVPLQFITADPECRTSWLRFLQILLLFLCFLFILSLNLLTISATSTVGKLSWLLSIFNINFVLWTYQLCREDYLNFISWICFTEKTCMFIWTVQMGSWYLQKIKKLYVWRSSRFCIRRWSMQLTANQHFMWNISNISAVYIIMSEYSNISTGKQSCNCVNHS